MRLSLSNTLVSGSFMKVPLKYYFVLDDVGGLTIQNAANWYKDEARTISAGSTPIVGSTAIFGSPTFEYGAFATGSLSTNFNSNFYGSFYSFIAQCGTGVMKFYGNSLNAIAEAPFDTDGVINDYTEFYNFSGLATASDYADYCRFYDNSTLYGQIGNYTSFYDFSITSPYSSIALDSAFYDSAIADACYILGDSYFYDNSECFAEEAQDVYLYNSSIFGGYSVTNAILHDSASIYNGYADGGIIVSYTSATTWNYPINKDFTYYRTSTLSVVNSLGSPITILNFTGTSRLEITQDIVSQYNFYNESWNSGDSTLLDSANFYNDSYNYGALNGAFFNGNSINYGTVENVEFRDNSQNFGVINNNIDVYYPVELPLDGTYDPLKVTYHGY